MEQQSIPMITATSLERVLQVLRQEGMALAPDGDSRIAIELGSLPGWLGTFHQAAFLLPYFSIHSCH